MPAKRYCCVIGCKNSEQNSPELTFYSFPKRDYQIEQRKRWIQAVRRITADKKPWEPNGNTRICCAHFVGGKKSNIVNNPSYVPTIFPPIYKKKVLSVAAVARYERLQKRNQRVIKHREFSDAKEDNVNHTNYIGMDLNEDEQKVQSTCCQTDPFDYIEDNHPKVNVLFCWSGNKNEASTQTNIVKRMKNDRIVIDKHTIVMNKKCEPNTTTQLRFSDIKKDQTMESQSPSTINSVTLKVDGQLDKQMEPENMNQTYIINSGVTSSNTLYDCEDDEEKMNLEIMKLNERILKVQNKWCNANGELKNIKKILIRHQQLELTKRNRRNISKEYGDIFNSLKIRFAIGKQGYNAIRSIYPLPSLTFLCTSMHTMDIGFGITKDIILVMQTKFSAMEKWRTDCILCIAEMPVKIEPWYDSKTNKYCSFTTLGDADEPGSHLMFFLLRGIHSDWKQIISVDVTTDSPKGVDIVKRINDVIEAAIIANLNIRGIVSDIGSSNSMWTELGVQVSDQCQKTFYEKNNCKIHVFGDVQQLLSYLRLAMLSVTFTLNQKVVDNENLPTCIINGSDVLELRQIPSLSPSHLELDDSINGNLEKPVDAATGFLGIETALGLECAMKSKLFENHRALTTVWFIRLLNKWISVMNSWSPTAITKDNVEETVKFLKYFMSIIRDLEFDVKGWEKLHTGLILSTTSFINIAQEVLDEDYPILLGSRLSQSALKNVLGEFKVNYQKHNETVSIREIKSMILSQLLSD